MSSTRTPGIRIDNRTNCLIIDKEHRGIPIYVRLGVTDQDSAERRLSEEVRCVNEMLALRSSRRATFADCAGRYLSAFKGKHAAEVTAWHIRLLLPYIGRLDVHSVHDVTLQTPLGPQSARVGRDFFATPFQGSFLMLVLFALVALAVQSQVHVPRPVHDTAAGKGRPLAEIARQPAFVVAVIAGALGYGLMNLLMTATPIAMDFCGHPFSAAAWVIEWHVVGMFLPGFFTGSLIRRFGTLRVILAGAGLTAIAVFVALNGISVAHFVAALALVGIGWNFMYTGGTTLLTETYAPNEKARTQGLNDLIVFTTMGVSSFASGALVTATGWETMNRAALPVLAIIACAAAWLMWQRRRVPAAA